MQLHLQVLGNEFFIHGFVTISANDATISHFVFGKCDSFLRYTDNHGVLKALYNSVHESIITEFFLS